MLERADHPRCRNALPDLGLVVSGLQNADQKRVGIGVMMMTYPMFVNGTITGEYNRGLRSVILVVLAIVLRAIM